MIWACGWWVSADPQVWSTAVSPMRAPRCLGSAANRDQGVGSDFQQQVIDDRLILIGDVGDWSRQGEHDMEIGHRQEFGLAVGQPLLGSGGLALGAVPVEIGR